MPIVMVGSTTPITPLTITLSPIVAVAVTIQRLRCRGMAPTAREGEKDAQTREQRGALIGEDPHQAVERNHAADY